MIKRERNNVELSYFESWGKELITKANHVRNLIGDIHWVSDGTHKENLLKDFIKSYLPPTVTITSGFIKPPNTDERCSKEQDVLITDLVKNTPYFRQNEFAIVPPSAVLATIESKSTFSSKNLKKALANIADYRLIMLRLGQSDRVWSGVCFFDDTSEKTVSSLGSSISSAIKDILISVANDLDGSTTENVYNLLPTCIFTVNDLLVFFKLSDDHKSLVIRIFRAKELAVALGLNDLFCAVRTYYGGGVTDDLTEILLAFDAKQEEDVILTF